MTKKVTGKELEKLIEGVLNEKGLPRQDLDLDNEQDLKDKLDIPLDVDPNYRDLANLLKKDRKPSELSKKDVEKAYDVSSNTSAVKGADFLKSNTTDAELRNAIDDIYKSSARYNAEKAKQEKDLYVWDTDPKDERKALRSANNIAKTKYFADLIVDKRGSRKEKSSALEALVNLATQKLAGISIIQDVLGSEGNLAKFLIDKFKKSELSKERLPAKAPKDEPAMTISDPVISTGGSDKARYRSELINVFSTVAQIGSTGDSLRSEDFWTDALKLIADFSSFVMSGKTNNNNLLNLSATEYLSLTIALDYCYRFAKEIEGGGGAYQFEAFLGLLANGYVGGKEAGIAGGPGEADFVYQTKNEKGELVPAMGSAKYYATTTASQSARSFEMYTPVAYVYALKERSDGATTSDAKAISKINNYIFTVEKVYGKGVEPQKKFQKLQEGTGGEAVPINKDDFDKLPAGRVVFKFTNTITGEVIGYYHTSTLDQIALKPGIIEGTLAATLELPGVNRAVLAKSHELASKEVGKQVGLAFKSFESLFKDLIEAKKKATEYSTNADKDTGMAALNAINSSKKNLVTLSTQIAKPKDRVDDKVQLQQESKKITAKHLQKLIEENFKK